MKKPTKALDTTTKIFVLKSEWEDELFKSVRAQWALELLGIPGVKAETFERDVIYTAFKLGLLKRS